MLYLAHVGTDWSKWTALGTISLAVLTFLLAVFAGQSLRVTRRVSRIRATLASIERSEVDKNFSKLRKNFSQWADSGRALELFENKELATQKEMFRDYLNNYELVALSVFKKALSEDYYRDWMGSTLVLDWVLARPYVQYARRMDKMRYNQRRFANFEKLAIA